MTCAAVSCPIPVVRYLLADDRMTYGLCAMHRQRLHRYARALAAGQPGHPPVPAERRTIDLPPAWTLPDGWRRLLESA